MKQLVIAIFILMMTGVSSAAQTSERVLLAKGQVCQRVYDNHSTIVCNKYPGQSVPANYWR